MLLEKPKRNFYEKVQMLTITPLSPSINIIFTFVFKFLPTVVSCQDWLIFCIVFVHTGHKGNGVCTQIFKSITVSNNKVRTERPLQVHGIW